MNVPWMLAPPTAGLDESLAQDGVSFSTIHYLTTVISIDIFQGFIIDGTVTSR